MEDLKLLFTNPTSAYDFSIKEKFEGSLIYIWGFMHHTIENNSIGDCIDFRKEKPDIEMKFVPHYVGLDNHPFEIYDKHSKLNRDSTFKRISDHSDPIKGNSLKYKRLSLNYMNSFFNDPDFPIEIKHSKASKKNMQMFVTNHPKCMEYYNNDSVLKLLYGNEVPNGKPSHWPIDKQSYIKTDSLNELIKNKNNFWFTYAVVPDIYIANLELIETYVFWSLKGKTISQTLDIGKLEDLTFDITISFNGGNQIFKFDENGKVVPSEDFYNNSY
jgi:hypothetical protein